MRIESESDFITFGDLFLNGEYDLAIDMLLASAVERSYVVDLGANVGFFYLRLAHVLTLKAAQYQLSYVGVEPSTRCFRRLLDEVSQHRARFTSATVQQGLVGARSGTGQFEESSFHIGSRVEKSGGVAVPYLDLASLLPGEARIGLLKIDIEGSEEELLKNYADILDRTDCIIIEIHGNLCDAGLCRQILDRSGFQQIKSTRSTEHFSVELYARA